MANERTFEGTSREVFQEALDDAIERALSSSGVADERVTWTLESVSGVKGGIGGESRLTVTIRARLDSDKTAGNEGYSGTE